MSTAASAEAIRRSKIAERLLVPAGFITTAGNAFQITAAAILVFTAEKTTLSVGWLFIAVSIPQVTLAVMFGKLADRVDRRMLCVVADLVSAVSAFALPVWLWLGGPTDLGSYLANFLLAATAALFIPANNALVKERVLDERLGKFNAHYEMATNTGMLSAAALAGFLVIWFGPTPLLVFNSLTFVVSAVLTYFIGCKPAQPAPEAGTATAETAPAEPAGARGARTGEPADQTTDPVVQQREHRADGRQRDPHRAGAAHVQPGRMADRRDGRLGRSRISHRRRELRLGEQTDQGPEPRRARDARQPGDVRVAAHPLHRADGLHPVRRFLFRARPDRRQDAADAGQPGEQDRPHLRQRAGIGPSPGNRGDGRPLGARGRHDGALRVLGLRDPPGRHRGRHVHQPA